MWKVELTNIHHYNQNMKCNTILCIFSISKQIKHDDFKLMLDIPTNIDRFVHSLNLHVGITYR